MTRSEKMKLIMKELEVSDIKSRDIAEVSDCIDSEDYFYCYEILKAKNSAKTENYTYAKELYDYAKDNNISDYYLAHKQLLKSIDDDVKKEIRQKFRLTNTDKNFSNEEYIKLEKYLKYDQINRDNIVHVENIAKKYNLDIDTVANRWYNYYEYLHQFEYLTIELLEKAIKLSKIGNQEKTRQNVQKELNELANKTFSHSETNIIYDLSELVSNEKLLKSINIDLGEDLGEYTIFKDSKYTITEIKRFIDVEKKHNISIEEVVNNWKNLYVYLYEKEWLTLTKLRRAKMIAELDNTEVFVKTGKSKSLDKHKVEKDFRIIIETEQKYEDTIKRFMKIV